MSTIALFGASGQIGTAILNALLTDPSLNTIQILAPGTSSKVSEHEHLNLRTKTIDLTSAKREDLAKDLTGVDVVVSALNGKALEAQSVIQDAAADVGVRRFYPSEYGSHHIYQRPGDTGGYIHPMWNVKDQCNEVALHHPAIAAGKMTYTLIGCGDFYNQPREKTWCPWTQTSPKNDEYAIHVIGSPDAAADFIHTEDFAAFLLETIRHPRVSENKRLNFVSDHISYEDIARLLENYSGKKVKKNVLPLEIMHKVLRDPGEAPKELRDAPSAFPVDFWFLVKGMQGAGRFWRAKGDVHNDLFPGVKVKTFEKYFQELFN